MISDHNLCTDGFEPFSIPGAAALALIESRQNGLLDYEILVIDAQRSVERAVNDLHQAVQRRNDYHRWLLSLVEPEAVDRA